MAGEILKQRRETLGLDIKEAADQLKIKGDYLTAIENDVFEKLPVPVYTIGYIRSYAQYLGVDPETIVRHYSKNLSEPPLTTIIPVGFSQKRTPGLVYLISALVVASGALFFYFTRQQNDPIDAFVSNDNISSAPSFKPVVSSALPGNVSAAENEHTLQIDAMDVTWLSIKFNDGTAEELLMRPRTSKTVTFRDKVSLKIGNAGGINVILDGSEIGRPGNPGQVLTVSYPNGV